MRRFVQLRLDEPRADVARVRMVASGIRHPDALVRHGVYSTPLPTVLGHEDRRGRAGCAGVTRVGPGEYVVLSAAYCSRCPQCRRGYMASCENLQAENFAERRADGSTASTDESGTPIGSHCFGQSSFAACANVAESSLIPIAPAAPLELLTPLVCGMHTGAGAVWHELCPRVGSSRVVSGVGAVDMAAIMAARLVGCSTVIAIDRHETRRGTAKTFGATPTVDASSGDTLGQLHRIMAGRGVAYTLDTTARGAVLTTRRRVEHVGPPGPARRGRARYRGSLRER